MDPLKKRILIWVAVCGGSALLYLGVFRELWQVSLRNEYATHVLMMPIMTFILLFRIQDRINAPERFYLPALVPIIAGLAIANPAGIVLLWIGAFLFLFGPENTRIAGFPLLFLILMIPIPEALLQHIIAALQRGSADGAAILFKLTGTPFYRDGHSFILPGINIEIAKQCSSIRSSLALLISAMLAAHLMLKTGWRQLVFVLLAVPMAMVKNAVRIVTLSLLAVHVDKKWLTGSDLHRDGGILFFMLALMFMLPVLLLLRRHE